MESGFAERFGPGHPAFSRPDRCLPRTSDGQRAPSSRGLRRDPRNLTTEYTEYTEENAVLLFRVFRAFRGWNFLMSGLFPCPAFQGFGPTSLDPAPEGTWHLVDGHKRSILRKGVRERCPKC